MGDALRQQVYEGLDLPEQLAGQAGLFLHHRKMLFEPRHQSDLIILEVDGLHPELLSYLLDAELQFAQVLLPTTFLILFWDIAGPLFHYIDTFTQPINHTQPTVTQFTSSASATN